MRAMVFRGPYKVRVGEKDIPAIEHPNDAIVRVIFGGDLRIGSPPVPRHDAGRPGRHDLRPRIIGEVHEVGSSSSRDTGQRRYVAGFERRADWHYLS